ncbi:MAG: hypothetical protein QM702_03680 [Rubrivivax sp.]
MNATDVGHDTIVGNGGDDQLEGRGGNDELYGQEDDDVLLGGIGADEIFGGDGDDMLYASGLGRSVHSRDGWSDWLVSGKGNDFVRKDTDEDEEDRIGDGDTSGDTIVT